MELTTFQRTTLEGWRRMKPQGLTWASGLKRLARTWALLVALLLAAYFVAPPVSAFIACFIAGAMVRDVGYLRSARKMWPVSLKVIDWGKVDELLKKNDKELHPMSG